MNNDLPKPVLILLQLWTFVPLVASSIMGIGNLLSAHLAGTSIAYYVVRSLAIIAGWTYLYWFIRPVKSERWSILIIIFGLAILGFCLLMIPIAILAPSFGGHIKTESVVWAAGIATGFAPFGAYFVRLIWPGKPSHT